MSDLLMHPATERQLAAVRRQPSHALLLSGPAGIGKGSLASQLAAQLLGLTAAAAARYPHIYRLLPDDKQTLSIDAVRQLEHLLSLKLPATKALSRAVIIENAQQLTGEAQNALLKTLEEPPADTVIILTASQPQSLLPTIRSRLQNLNVQKPPLEALRRHFGETVADNRLEQHLLISGGLPGLLAALQAADDHPLQTAVAMARDILRRTAFERLQLVDELSKQKNLAYDTCSILLQMAEVAMARADDPAFRRWQHIQTAVYQAQEQLLANAQPKLVLTRLMLAL